MITELKQLTETDRLDVLGLFETSWIKFSDSDNAFIETGRQSFNKWIRSYTDNAFA